MLPIPRSPSEAAVLATSTSSPSPPGTAWRPVVPASPAIDQGLKWKYHNYIHSVYNYNNILYICIYIYVCMYIITIFWQCIIYWLVVEPPLWKIWVKVSWDDDIPNWMEKSNMFQTTNQCIYMYVAGTFGMYFVPLHTSMYNYIYYTILETTF